MGTQQVTETEVLHHLKEWHRCQLHGSIGGVPRHPSHLASWKLEPQGYPTFDHGTPGDHVSFDNCVPYSYSSHPAE